MIRKKILMVIDSLGAGGAEKVALNLASALQQENYHIDIITIDNIVSYEVDKEISLYTLDFKKGLFDYYRYRKKLHKMADDLQSDGAYEMIIVHLQKSTRLMKEYQHKRLVNVVHSTLSQASLSDRKGLRKYLKVRRLKRIYDGLNLIAVSNGIAEDIKMVGIKPNSLNVIYNPVDVNELAQKAQQPSGCQCDNDYIVYVGRLAESKRHDRALQAYKNSGITESFLIVGEGEMRISIESQIISLGLEGRVKLCGFQSNPYSIIKKAKLLVLSSDYEGLPTVLIEALSLGVPVVSTDCPSGPREILREFMPDSLVSLDDVDALAAAIKEHVENTTAIADVLVKRFDSKTIAMQYLKGI